MIKNFESLKTLLAQPQPIVITTHQSPDGDAMGSSLGLLHYLQKKGHKVTVVAPTPYADFLKWMPGNKEVIIYTFAQADAKAVIDEAKVFFCLDFNSTKRVGDVTPLLEESKAVKVVIDHHLFPEDFADYLYSDTAASSTCEMVYNFIEMMGDLELMDKTIGSCLYTGILTDTGGFQFPATTARVHQIAAHLIDLGIENSWIYHTVFNSFSEMRLRLLGHCIENMKTYPEYHAAMIALDRDELAKFQIKTGDTEGIVNYPLKVIGVNFSVFIADRTEQIKLSFRSVGSFDVNVFARKYFNGGGHANAAGGASKDTLFNTIKRFEEALPEFKEQLNY